MAASHGLSGILLNALRNRRPTRGVRLAAMKWTPVKKRPSPARNGARAEITIVASRDGPEKRVAISYQGLANVQALSDMNVEIEKSTINVSRPMELSYFCNEAAGSSVTLGPAAWDRERPQLCRLVGLQIERKGNDVALANPTVV